MNTWFEKFTDINEVLIIHELKHSGIIPDFQIVHTSEGIVLKTEKYPLNLSQYISRGYDASMLIHKIKHLISVMHQHGVIHGDLHADNIIVNPKNQDVRIIDFNCGYMIGRLQYCDDPHTAAERAKKNDYKLLQTLVV
jgi:tRNA A-37 threonylcarbamoyl transferase component Bud32